ncbi:MAG: hypothetical protein ACXVRP_05000 [Solirubrobacteraceae bacterium]
MRRFSISHGRTRLPIALLATGLLALAGCGSSSSSSSSTQSTASASTTGPSSTAQPAAPTMGYEGIPLQQGADLAPAGTTLPGTTVDGIQCGATEQLAYHIHAHLAVYDQGAPRAIPAGVGIPGALVQQSQYGPVVGQGKCFYWLHTHTPDGVLHIESPTTRVYTLGNFFDEWGQPLTASQVGPSKGKVTAYVNGKLWTKSPRLIPLDPHAAIQLDVGTPATPYQPVSFAGTQL